MAPPPSRRRPPFSDRDLSKRRTASLDRFVRGINRSVLNRNDPARLGSTADRKFKAAIQRIQDRGLASTGHVQSILPSSLTQKKEPLWLRYGCAMGGQRAVRSVEWFFSVWTPPTSHLPTRSEMYRQAKRLAGISNNTIRAMSSRLPLKTAMKIAPS